MIRQHMVAAVDIHGAFVAIDRLSRAASRSGAKLSDVIGKKLWDFSAPSSAAVILKNFSDCLIHQKETEYTVSSTIGDKTEHWQCRLKPCPSAAVMSFAAEVLPESFTPFTQDERRILSLLVEDMPIDEIAEQMGVNNSTMGSRMRRLREKCGCRTNHGLVAWCGRYGVS